MKLREKIFRKHSIRREQTKLIDEAGSICYSGYSNAYENDVFRSAVDAVARNGAKLKGTHFISYKDHGRTEGNCKINKLLQIRPNLYMSAFDFYYKLISNLYISNNAFAFLERDEAGRLNAIYPIDHNGASFLSAPNGDLYVKFILSNTGKECVLPYSDIIHLRRFYSGKELLGNDNNAIFPGLELAQADNEGNLNAIKSGARIRGLLKCTQILSPSKLKETKEAFMKDFLTTENDGGVIAVDEKMDYQPIDNKPVILDEAQSKQIKTKIYNYIGISENIVNSNYSEDEFSAFYESVLEPLATAMSQEFTSKIFSEREITFGNEIVFESGRLQFTSNATKVNLISQLVPLGLLTINQALEILNLPSVEDGDKRLQALNMIDSTQAMQYQQKGSTEPDSPITAQDNSEAGERQ